MFGKLAIMSTEQLTQLPPLEALCEVCKGKRGERGWHGWSSCYNCNGVGHVPTEFGKQVLSLIKHNLDLGEHGLVKWRDDS